MKRYSNCGLFFLPGTISDASIYLVIIIIKQILTNNGRPHSHPLYMPIIATNRVLNFQESGNNIREAILDMIVFIRHIYAIIHVK